MDGLHSPSMFPRDLSGQCIYNCVVINYCSILSLFWRLFFSLNHPVSMLLTQHFLHFYFIHHVITSSSVSGFFWFTSCVPASLPPPLPLVHQDFEKISEFFKANYKVEVTEKDMCVKGWNWGTAKFSGN